MLKVEILPGGASEVHTDVSKGGKPYTWVDQSFWVFISGVYPQRVVQRLFNREPMLPGVYEMTSACFGVGRFDRLEVDLGQCKLISGASKVAAVK